MSLTMAHFVAQGALTSFLSGPGAFCGGRHGSYHRSLTLSSRIQPRVSRMAVRDLLFLFGCPTTRIAFNPPSCAARVGRLPAAVAIDTKMVDAQAKAFQAGVPTARVVQIPQANHYIFISNEADVLREMRAFIERLN